MNNSVESVEYLDSVINNKLFTGYSVSFLNIAALIAFVGGRHVISDFYDHRKDILCLPIVKVLILFSILYMNIKDIKISIILFFCYIFFIDNYITDKCDKNY